MKKYLLIGFMYFFFLDCAWSGGGDHKEGCISKACSPRKRAHTNGFCVECSNNLRHLFYNRNNSDTGESQLNTDRVVAEDQNPNFREDQPIEPNVPEGDDFWWDREVILNSMKRFHMGGAKIVDYDLLLQKGFQEIVFNFKKIREENKRHDSKSWVENVISYLAIHDPARLIEYHGSMDRLVAGISENIIELGAPINAFDVVRHIFTELTFENIVDFSDEVRDQESGTWVLLNGFESKNLIIIHRTKDYYIAIHPLVGFFKIPIIVKSEKLILRALVGFYMDNGGFNNIRYFKAKSQTKKDDNPPDTVDDVDEEVAGLTADTDNNVINFRVPVNPLNATYDVSDWGNLGIHRVINVSIPYA